MRKILIGVVSVAGLLAVVLALASSPASAAKDVITVRTDAGTTSQAGTYTVTWETKGGCDPGAGTSGPSGSLTLTVADADGDGTGTTGPTQETGVVTDTDCTYTWKASLVKADGARCKLADPAPNDGGTAALTYVGENCNFVEKVTFVVVGYTTPAVLCTQDDIDDAETGDPCAGGTAGTTEKTAAVPPTDRVKGAVKETTFTVTATEKVPAGGKADEDCATVSGETKVNDTSGATEVVLALTDQTLNGRDCQFNVTAELPDGFAVGAKGSNSVAIVMGGPGESNQATVGGAGDGSAALTATVQVTIATRTVHLVQNVIGDAGGANATYTYTAPCGAPGLPGALGARKDVGGIQTQAGTTIVELREGRFNVSGAIGDAGGTKAAALDKKGAACTATVAVSGVPASCSSESTQTANLATSGASTIIEFTIDCTPAPEPEPPADDGGDMMDDGGDMMDDGGDAGPPADVPTG